MDRGDRGLPLQRTNRYSSTAASSSASKVPARYGHRRISDNPPESTRTRAGSTTGNSGVRRTDVWHKRQNEENKADKHHGDPTDVSFIIGTCPYMCPERERVQRERLRDLAVFERLNGNPGKTSIDLAVKKFCRTISTLDVRALDVRPLPVLEETLKYLLKLLDSRELPFQVVHDFIFDRTRSIRQDLSMQNIANDRAIHLYEEMVKFHVISHHRLRSCSGPSISSTQHLNMEQLAKALTSLYNLYDANRKLSYIYENEAEFRSLYVLLHLDPNSEATGESLSLWFRRVTFALMKSKEVCFARKVLRLFRQGNYKGFLCATASEATYLQYCIIEPHINEIRSLAVLCINSVGYKLHPYPLLRLSKLLMMKESDVESLCNACGLETLVDADGVKVLPTKQTTFCHPKEGFQSYVLVGLEHIERKGLLSGFIMRPNDKDSVCPKLGRPAFVRTALPLFECANGIYL